MATYIFISLATRPTLNLLSISNFYRTSKGLQTTNINMLACVYVFLCHIVSNASSPSSSRFRFHGGTGTITTNFTEQQLKKLLRLVTTLPLPQIKSPASTDFDQVDAEPRFSLLSVGGEWLGNPDNDSVFMKFAFLPLWVGVLGLALLYGKCLCSVVFLLCSFSDLFVCSICIPVLTLTLLPYRPGLLHFAINTHTLL